MTLPLVLLKRESDEPEPLLARELRDHLRASPLVTQALGPWWIYSKGTRDDPNDGATQLDVDHLTHLHITTIEGLA